MVDMCISKNVFLYPIFNICKNRIWDLITDNGWYAIKSKQNKPHKTNNNNHIQS